MDELKATMRKALEVLVEEAIKEIKEQGHVASGKSIRSFEIKLVKTFNGIVGEVYGADTLRYVDGKVKPHFPPIKALIRWAKFVKPQLDNKGQERFAWAVATNMAKEGIPSRGAFPFSKNGRRLNWTEVARAASEERIDEILQNADWVERSLDNILRSR